MRPKDLVTGQSSYCDSVAERNSNPSPRLNPFIYLFFSCEATSLSTCLPVLLIIWEYILEMLSRTRGEGFGSRDSSPASSLAHQGKKHHFPWAGLGFISKYSSERNTFLGKKAGNSMLVNKLFS